MGCLRCHWSLEHRSVHGSVMRCRADQLIELQYVVVRIANEQSDATRANRVNAFGDGDAFRIQPILESVEVVDDKSGVRDTRQFDGLIQQGIAALMQLAAIKNQVNAYAIR